MINASNEVDYLYRGLRALVGFQLAKIKAWVRYGHAVRRRDIAKYLETHTERKVHIGSTYDAEGFLNSQIQGRVPIDITKPLPFPDRSIDLMYASHVVEHLHRHQFTAFLDQAHRVLRDGGRLLVATPSVSKMVETLWGDNDEARRTLLARGSQHALTEPHTRGSQLNVTMRAFGHRWLYDQETVEVLGRQAGFARVGVIPSDQLPDDALNGYIRKRKPPGWFLETETYELVR